MFTVRTAISLLVAAGLSIGGMLVAPDQIRAKVRSTARTAVQAASEVVADLRAGADELKQAVHLEADTRAAVQTGSEGRVDTNHADLTLDSRAVAQAEADAQAQGNLDLDGPFDLGSWIKVNIFGSADGSVGW